MQVYRDLWPVPCARCLLNVQLPARPQAAPQPTALGALSEKPKPSDVQTSRSTALGEHTPTPQRICCRPAWCCEWAPPAMWMLSCPVPQGRSPSLLHLLGLPSQGFAGSSGGDRQGACLHFWGALNCFGGKAGWAERLWPWSLQLPLAVCRGCSPAETPRARSSA